MACMRSMLIVMVALWGGWTADSALAATRSLSLSAPASVSTGAGITIEVSADTTAGGGERIGFLHGEYSTDGGRTWKGFYYENNIGPSETRRLDLKAGAAGSTVQVRARVAFRDGLAGDVDYRGAAIRWHETWGKWREPPAKSVTITVTAE